MLFLVTILVFVVTLRFENLGKDEGITLTKKDGTQKVVIFGKGYWSFNSIAKRMKEEGISFKRNEHNNTCRIHCETDQVNLENVGTLIGFERNKVVPVGAYVDSGNVDVNLGLRYFTIGCNLVNEFLNKNKRQGPSNVTATIPIVADETLNGSVTNFGDQRWCAPLGNGERNNIEFYVKDNTLNQVLKLSLLSL